MLSAMAASTLTLDGGEYRILSTYPGDQMQPQLAFGPLGGYS